MKRVLTVSFLVIGTLTFVFGMWSYVFTRRPAVRAVFRHETMTGDRAVTAGNTNFLSPDDLASCSPRTMENYQKSAADGRFLSEWLEYNIVVVIGLSVLVVALSSIMLSKGMHVTVKDLTSNQ